MPNLEQLFGRIVRPEEVPDVEPTPRTPSGTRLETELKVLDAVLPVELGGTVDLLGPAGLGQLVLVVEIATHINAVVVAAGADNAFAGLVTDDLGVQTVVVEGEPIEAGRAADRLAGALALAGRTVLLVVDAVTWDAHAPESGLISEGAGSITAFRFAPHPRDGEPLAPLVGAGTSIVYSTDLFVSGFHPAIDVLDSRSALIEEARLDPITIGAARAAREALTKAHEVRIFLTQPLILAEPHTGMPGEQVPARTATEELAALVR